MTMYRSSFVEEQALMQYSQTAPPGRTYKYYQNPVVFPFGGAANNFCAIFSRNGIVCQDMLGTNARKIQGGVVSAAGMGYHDSSIACSLSTAGPADDVDAKKYLVACNVSHLGGPSGDEVVQLYHVPPAGLNASVDHPVPIKRLIAFERVALPSAAAAVGVGVAFKLSSEDLRLVDKSGGQSLYPGSHGLEVWLGHGLPVSLSAVVPAAATEA